MRTPKRNALTVAAVQGMGRKAQTRESIRQTDRTTPNTGTQADSIAMALKAGEAITALTALRRFGCLRAAAVIFALRRAGWRIDTEMVCVQRNDGRASHHARYRLKGTAQH